MTPLRVAFATPELSPWCGTGGLGDVASALPRALRSLGAGAPQVAVFVPLYRAARQAVERRGERLVDTGVDVAADLGGERLGGRFLALDGGDPPVFFLDCGRLYERDGLYVDDTFREHHDNALRYAFFCRAVLEGAAALCGGPPDLLHANDWQTALLPLYLARERARLPRTATLFTIHNLAYQGDFPKEDLADLGLDWSVFTMEQVEFHDRINLLKGGIAFADRVTTVSPTYAAEILGPEQGNRLDGFLRAHAGKLRGILNGIDCTEWSPALDARLPARYDLDHLDGKRRCRAALLAEVGLAAADETPLLAVVSRFAQQKGIDLVAELAPWIAEQGARLVVLGTGDFWLEQRFRELAVRHPDAIAVRLDYDVGFAHRLFAGADLLLMPSRFEPCGLTQMYAMTYGTVPVVRAVGGLRDTVVDATPEALAAGTATGFSFTGGDAASLQAAIARALAAHANPALRRALQRGGMSRDLAWTASARAYAELYEEAAAARQ